MSTETALLVVAGVIGFILMQSLPRPVSARSLILIPAALAYVAWHNLPSGPITAAQAAELACELGLATAAGIWQARATRVFQRDGRWYMRGGPGYLAIWAGFAAARVVLQATLGGGAAVTAGAGGNLWILWVSVAAVWVVRTLALYLTHPELASALRGGGEAGYNPSR